MKYIDLHCDTLTELKEGETLVRNHKNVDLKSNPQELGENYEGETSIGCRIRGLKDGKERTYYVYNNCSHQEAYKETGMQGVSYTTGVPAMIGAMMFFKGEWKRPGVNNVEEFDPDPFMDQLNKQGLPWHEVFDGDLEL